MVDEPVVDEPVVDDAAADEPTADEPTADETVLGEAVVDEPVLGEPVLGDAVTAPAEIDGAGIDAGSIADGAIDTPVVDTPVVEVPVVEVPLVEVAVVNVPLVDVALGDPDTSDLPADALAEAGGDDAEIFTTSSMRLPDGPRPTFFGDSTDATIDDITGDTIYREIVQAGANAVLDPVEVVTPAAVDTPVFEPVDAGLMAPGVDMQIVEIPQLVDVNRIEVHDEPDDFAADNLADLEELADTGSLPDDDGLVG